MLVEGNRIRNADHIGVTRIGPQGRSPRGGLHRPPSYCETFSRPPVDAALTSACTIAPMARSKLEIIYVQRGGELEFHASNRVRTLEGKLIFCLRWRSENFIAVETLGKRAIGKLGGNVTRKSSTDKPPALRN